MNRSELRSRILTAFNDATGVFLTSDQANDTIQEALDVLAEEAELVKRTAFTALRDGWLIYDTRLIASDMLAPSRVYLPYLDRRLEAMSIREADAHHEQWMRVTGDPWWWIPVSRECFALYPHPATGGGILRVDYFAWPPDLQDDADEPELYGADSDAVVLYGLYDGYCKQWAQKAAVEAWALFAKEYLPARARSTLRGVQSRSFHRAAVAGDNGTTE